MSERIINNQPYEPYNNLEAVRKIMEHGNRHPEDIIFEPATIIDGDLEGYKLKEILGEPEPGKITAPVTFVFIREGKILDKPWVDKFLAEMRGNVFYHSLGDAIGWMRKRAAEIKSSYE